MRGYPKFSLWIPIALSKDLLFQRGPNLAQKPLYLAGTVLKRETMIWPKEIGGLDLPISSSENSKNRQGTVAPQAEH